MATRTVKLYGKVWGNPESPATITVNFGGQQQYQGPVATAAGTADPHIQFQDMIVMATWEVDLAVSGSTDFAFAITGGDAIFHTMHANYMGPRIASYKFVAGAIWPAYQPSEGIIVYWDSRQLDDADFQNQYGLTKAQALAQIEPDQTLTTEQNFDDFTGPSTMESDGHNDVRIDGVPQPRIPTEGELGKWTYVVQNGQTLTCSVQALPAIQ